MTGENDRNPLFDFDLDDDNTNVSVCVVGPASGEGLVCLKIVIV